jgi:hypothetical protein
MSCDHGLLFKVLLIWDIDHLRQPVQTQKFLTVKAVIFLN